MVNRDQYPQYIAIVSIIVVASGAFFFLRTDKTNSRRNHWQPSTNAVVGNSGFDAENDGEFNAVEAVESMPATKMLEKDVDSQFDGSNVGVVCGAGSDHGRDFWVVDVYVIDKMGKDVIRSTYHYSITTGKLTLAPIPPVGIK